MKRDMDIIRDTMLALEKDNDLDGVGFYAFSENEPVIERADPKVAFYHLQLCVAGGLLDDNGQEVVGHVVIRGLTWEGHDFLDAVRDDNIWAEVKSVVKKQGYELTFDVAKSLAMRLLSTSIGL
ncbi:MAG: DUF2513 domain-containing protein [Sneathiella sp.]